METGTDVLLVVDDESCITRSVSRLMMRYFERVLVASNPQEAEQILHSEPVTHLICDEYFGVGTRSGAEVLNEWRHAYPGIRKAVLFTGDDPGNIPETPGVQVMAKLSPCKDLLQCLKKVEQAG